MDLVFRGIVGKSMAVLANIQLLLAITFLLLSCSNGVSESLGPKDTPSPSASAQDKDAAAANQNKAAKPDDVLKECSFEYSAASGKEKINWPGTKKNECEAKCRSGRPQGILGICLFDNTPLSVEFSSEKSNGLLSQTDTLGSNPISGSPNIPRSGCALVEVSNSGTFKMRAISVGSSQICVEHCASSTLDTQTKSAICYYDGAKVSDVGSQKKNTTDSGNEVGTCKRNSIDLAGARVSETDQKLRSECATLCDSMRQNAKSVECTFNGGPVLSFSVGSSSPGPSGQTMQNCVIAHRDQATGESLTTNEPKPKYEECEESCLSKVKSSSVVLKCSFGSGLPFLDVNFGDNFSDSSSVSCTINSSTSGNSKISTSTMLRSECRKKCTDAWASGADILRCSVL